MVGLLAGTAGPVTAAVKAPPSSDGSSGSFDAQFGNGATAYGGLSYWNLDTGQVVTTQGVVAFTVPFETITWNGQPVKAYNFSSFTVEQTIHLTLYGATPAVLLAQGNISIAGAFVFQNTNVTGGTPSTGVNNAFNGGPGSGIGGAGGGEGRGGQVETSCGPSVFSGSGGGGGGNYRKGGAGLKNYIVEGAGGSPPSYPGGPGGHAEQATVLQGGGGGAAGGGGLYGGDYYGGSPGGNGGGAVVFATPGTITLTSTGVVNAAGGAGGGASGITGGSGGGAGGDVWLFSSQGVSNAGQILANGGAGSTISLAKSACKAKPVVKGPDGGNGSGGVLFISSPTIANSGTINLAGGNGSAGPNGGLLDGNGVAVINTGSIIGAAKTE